MLNFDSQLSYRQVGQTLADMPLGSIIEKLAISIAQAQRALDRQAMLTFSEMATEKVRLPTPDGGVTERSMLELGFAPSFYHFDSVVIEIKVEIKLHVAEEQRVGFGFDDRPGAGRTGTGQPGGKPNEAPAAKDPLKAEPPKIDPTKKAAAEKVLTAENAVAVPEKATAEKELAGMPKPKTAAPVIDIDQILAEAGNPPEDDGTDDDEEGEAP